MSFVGYLFLERIVGLRPNFWDEMVLPPSPSLEHWRRWEENHRYDIHKNWCPQCENSSRPSDPWLGLSLWQRENQSECNWPSSSFTNMWVVVSRVRTFSHHHNLDLSNRKLAPLTSYITFSLPYFMSKLKFNNNKIPEGYLSLLIYLNANNK